MRKHKHKSKFKKAIKNYFQKVQNLYYFLREMMEKELI